MQFEVVCAVQLGTVRFATKGERSSAESNPATNEYNCLGRDRLRTHSYSLFSHGSLIRLKQRGGEANLTSPPFWLIRVAQTLLLKLRIVSATKKNQNEIRPSTCKARGALTTPVLACPKNGLEISVLKVPSWK